MSTAATAATATAATTGASPTGTPGSALSSRPGNGRITLLRVMHSEWIKFRSLRSSYITLAATAVITIGFSALICWANVSRWDRLPAAEKAGFVPVEESLRGYFLAQMAVGVLGVLIVTGEYSTGMIRASLSAVPKRLPVLWSKTVVFGAIVWVVNTVCVLIAFFVGQSILSGKHLDTTLSAAGVTRVVLGTALYLTAVGLLAVGIGTMLRNTAGGIASVFGLLLVVPLLAEALPSSWRDNIAPYLPSSAGQSLATLHPVSPSLAPWTGFGVLCVYVAVALIGAAVVLKRRDA
jgi:ABC-2 type transport system permease protein